jgi:hypothetical protein
MRNVFLSRRWILLLFQFQGVLLIPDGIVGTKSFGNISLNGRVQAVNFYFLIDTSMDATYTTSFLAPTPSWNLL